MKRRIAVLFLGILCVLAGTIRVSAEVLAHGTAESYWVATIRREPGGEVQSIIQHRPVGSGAPWSTIARINTPLRSLTNLGKDLVALLENGEWMLIWQGGSSSGVVPEDGSKLMQLAGENQTLRAIVAAQLGRRPTTGGATQPAATMPAATKLLYRLERGEWSLLAALPAAAQDAGGLSLSFIDGTLMLAALLGEGRIITYRFDAEARAWQSIGDARVPTPVSRIKLLPDLGRPTLWASEEKGPSVLLWRDASWSDPVPLSIPADKIGEGVQDVTVAGRNVRALVQVDGKLSDYSFDRTAKSQGSAASVPAPGLPPESQEYEWLTAVAAAALLIVLMNTMRRREPITPETLAKAGVVLAPYGRRFLAGLVDALPVIGTAVIVALRSKTADLDSAFESARYPIYIAMGIYILHTLVCEMLWGWTIGKRLFGLRVAMVDGVAPAPRAILLRNLLRVPDVMMMLAPLLIIILSPLRQRIGDIVAETIVIKDEGRTIKNEKGEKTTAG